MLIDRQIRQALESGELVVNPADSIDARIQPASLDVRLGDTFAVFNHHMRDDVIDPKVDTSGFLDYFTVTGDDHFTVYPGDFVLATTLEEIGLADTLAARVEGKSSLGRLGIFVHSTAGFVDPGWSLASITLEISTVVGIPVRLYPGMPIAQLAFERVEAVTAGYSGKYTGQVGPTPSAFHRNWTGSAWT